MSRCANRPPTPRQLELLLWLRQWWADHDSSPSLNDASRALGGISNSSIDGKLRSLHIRGLVLQVVHPATGRSRGWRLSMAGEILCRRVAGDVQPVRPQPVADEAALLNRQLLQRERALRRRYQQLKADRDARAFLQWLDQHVGAAQ